MSATPEQAKADAAATDIQNFARKRRPLHFFLAVCAILLVAGVGWYFSPAGRLARLKRMDTQALVAYTAQNPQDYDALMEMAQRLEQRFPSETVTNYLQAARMHPDRTEPWRGAWRVAMKSGDGASAMEAAQGAVKSAADKSSALAMLGAVYARGGLWEQALDAYQQATQRNAGNAEAWDGIAQAALQRKKLTDAVSAGEQAVRLDAAQGQYWLHLARARRAVGDLPGAKAAAQISLQHDRLNADAMTEFGIVLFQLAHDPLSRMAAEYPLQMAADELRDTPQAYEACYQLGQVYLAEKKYALAEGVLRRALKARPDDEAAQFALSRSLSLQGKLPEANALMKQFQQQSQYALAVSQLQMRIGREPQRADLLARLATLYAGHGAWQEAAAIWKRCVELAPDRTDWQHRLAEAQRH